MYFYLYAILKYLNNLNSGQNINVFYVRMKAEDWDKLVIRE